MEITKPVLIGCIVLLIFIGFPVAWNGGYQAGKVSARRADATANYLNPSNSPPRKLADIPSGFRTTPPATAYSQPASSPMSSTGQWQVVKEWTGQSIKTTESFTIPSDEWAIAWQCTPTNQFGGNFVIIVKGQDGRMTDMVGNVMGAASDTSYLRGKGTYFLDINSSMSYAITVSAKY